MSSGKWLWTSLRRYVLTIVLAWVAAASVLPALGDEPFIEEFALEVRVGLVGVPLLTVATMFVLVLLVSRRFEPPTGGAQRIRGGWMVILPLLLLLPVGMLIPLQYLIMLGAQLAYVVWVLPCEDARDTANVLGSLVDPAVPAELRARTARAVAGLGPVRSWKPWCSPRRTRSRRSPKRQWRASAPSGGTLGSSAKTSWRGLRRRTRTESGRWASGSAAPGDRRGIPLGAIRAWPSRTSVGPGHSRALRYAVRALRRPEPGAEDPVNGQGVAGIVEFGLRVLDGARWSALARE